MRIIAINYNEELYEKIGCRRGNHPTYTIHFDNGESYSGKRCKCMKGCKGTDNILPIHVGDQYEDMEGFKFALNRMNMRKKDKYDDEGVRIL